MEVSVNQFNDKVNTFLKELPASVQKIHELASLSFIPIIKKRIVDKGIIGDNKSLGQYSDKPISPGLLLGAGKGTKASSDNVKKYLNQQKKQGLPELISYKKFRELDGLPTDHITISATGETLKDVSILKNEIQGNEIVTVIGSRNSKTKQVYNKKGVVIGTIGTADVLEKLNDRYGKALDAGILDLTPQEEKEVNELFEIEMQQLLDKYFA